MNRMLLLGLFAAAIIVAVIMTGCKHINPCTANAGDCYSIQGLYSQPTCPGQRVMTVEIDNSSLFLECY
jgi:hypothetical protein